MATVVEHRETRQKLLKSALDLFWENNYDTTSSTSKWQEVRNYQNSMYVALKADSATDDIIIATPPLIHLSESG